MVTPHTMKHYIISTINVVWVRKIILVQDNY